MDSGQPLVPQPQLLVFPNCQRTCKLFTVYVVNVASRIYYVNAFSVFSCNPLASWYNLNVLTNVALPLRRGNCPFRPDAADYHAIPHRQVASKNRNSHWPESTGFSSISTHVSWFVLAELVLWTAATLSFLWYHSALTICYGYQFLFSVCAATISNTSNTLQYPEPRGSNSTHYATWVYVFFTLPSLLCFLYCQRTSKLLCLLA